MSKSPSCRLHLLAGASLIAAIAGTAPASAQTTQPLGTSPPAAPLGSAEAVPGPAGTAGSEVAAADVAPEEEIVVTGSRIARPTLDSPIPVTTLTQRDLTRTGQVAIGDVLNDLPSLRSTYSQANSTQFIGTAGLNLLDLRGLGISRTLVLVNGRRHVTSQEGEFLVDTNTIPTDLIDRVDIVTGGSSAVYGSDANAGVVNFVLKRDFEGASFNAQSGIGTNGNRGTYRLTGTVGKNFAEGRGNIAVSGEYNYSDLLRFTDRPGLTGAYGGRRQFQQVDDPTLDNTIPNRTFIDGGIRSFGFDNGGNFIAYNGGSTRSCADGVAAACRANGFPRVFGFQPDGALREYNYGTDYRPAGSNNSLNGDGATLNDRGSLNPRLERYVVNALAHYDVSNAFRPFFEAKFVRVKSFAEGTPTFGQGGDQGVFADVDAAGNPVGVAATPDTFLGSGVPIFFDNAYLRPEAAGTIRALLPAGSNFFRVNRNNNDFGTRDEATRRDTYRFVAGAEGTFNDDWKYDVSFNYGEFRSRTRFPNNRIEANFLNAVDAVRNGAGQIVCRINQATVTDPNCVPLNILGNGAPSRGALNYINTTSLRTGQARQYDVNANLIGDSSQLFELPGGPVRFAIGAEYRRETARSSFDELVRSGGTFLNAIPDFRPPSFVVKEAYGELELPILSDVRFAQELTLNGAGRVADYKGSTGTVFAYNGGALYAPVRDIKFRINYSRSVRAPTLGDLYASPSQNFDLIDDPCDVNFINTGRDTRAANCAAAGVPAGFENSVTRSSSLEFLSGGNPNLTEERSRSWTYGVVIQPSFVRGLSITADYYDIKISNVISPVDAQTILDACYDAPTLENQFCALINPRQAGGLFQRPALLQSVVNFAALKAKGVDVDVAYNYAFDADNKVVLRAVGNYVRTRTDFPYLDTPDRPERIKGELGDPIYQVNLSADYTHRNVTLGYQLRYIGRQSITDWEAQHDTNGVPALDPFYADRINYPAVFYHNARASIDLDRRFTFYGGVDNLTDRRPPLGLLGTGDGDGIYDNIGRFAYVGASVKF